MLQRLRYQHFTIPTTEVRAGEIFLAGAHAYLQPGAGRFGVRWIRFDPDSCAPELLRTVPHVAFATDNLARDLAGQTILVPPTAGLGTATLAFIVHNGAPVLLLEADAARAGAAGFAAGPGAPPGMRYHHVGIPTRLPRDGERHLPHLDLYVEGYESSPFGVEWIRFGPRATAPTLLREIPHAAFEVDDLDAALVGMDVLIPPDSPSDGVRVAFVRDAGLPIELLELARERTMAPRG
jgi:catechol 2,3-dioxygenase-like lactoylglutathione lyase family enzyme